LAAFKFNLVVLDGGLERVTLDMEMAFTVATEAGSGISFTMGISTTTGISISGTDTQQVMAHITTLETEDITGTA